MYQEIALGQAVESSAWHATLPTVAQMEKQKYVHIY
jgi:hypothetical protein